jgi:hypothetical protein
MATPSVKTDTVQNPVASKDGSKALVSMGELSGAQLVSKNPAQGVKQAGCGDIKTSASGTPVQPQSSQVKVPALPTSDMGAPVARPVVAKKQ